MAQAGHSTLSPRHWAVAPTTPKTCFLLCLNTHEQQNQNGVPLWPVVIFSLQGTWMNGLRVSFWSAFPTRPGDSLWGPMSAGHRSLPFHLLPLQLYENPTGGRQACHSLLLDITGTGHIPSLPTVGLATYPKPNSNQRDTTFFPCNISEFYHWLPCTRHLACD